MPSIPDTLRVTAARCPRREALVFGDRRRTYAELHAEVERTATALAAAGVRPTDRVLVMAGNSDAFVITAYAVLRVGAILSPANPRNAVPELAHQLRDSGASAIVHTDEHARVVHDAVAQAGTVPVVLSWSALVAAAEHEDASLDRAVGEFDDALLLYTSGTTGAAKGALFDHHRALWVAVSISGAVGYRDGDRTLHVAPLYHAAQLALALLAGTALGMTHVVLPGFEPAAVADALARERITVFFGVPTMYQFLLRLPDLADRDLSAWRVGMFGAAPMPSHTAGELAAALPTVELYQLCGQTEAGPGGIYTGPAEVAARPDASGRHALPHSEARVVSLDTGEETADGEVGELVLRGESVMKGYWNRPEATAETLRGGWLHTGDLATRDADGYVTLVDRLKDLIITGGLNVYSAEVENALASHPALLDVAVVGVPHPDYGQSILAVIEPREGTAPTLDELRGWAAARIADYKAPHAVLVHPIPRNPSGKIQKHRLRDEVTDATVAGRDRVARPSTSSGRSPSS